MSNEFKVRKGLIVNGSGSIIFDVLGSQGELFSITDSLSGSLFSVNDISGIPILNVSSNNSVVMGTYGAYAISVSGSVAKVSGSFTGSFTGSLYSNSLFVSGSTSLSGSLNASGSVTFSSLGTGTVSATSGLLSTTSDMTLKIEDGYIDNALEKVLKLTPRYFHWKEESGLPVGIRQLGFYAQEVNLALGEETANTPRTENDKWGIYDRGIVAFLTKAIQELKAEFDEYKSTHP